ncbi:conserved hypothetical protein [gamma proteobacterium HTCC5015]|nr:conserved hypothetical protein [gamma proteobacterium HTCC5015]
MSLSSQASDLVLEAQIASGGDTITSSTSGDQKLKAGDALHLAIGSSWPLNPDETTRFNATIGYSWSREEYSNAEASISRFPVELSINQWFKNVALSAGFSYHMNPQIDIEANGASGEVDLDNALGVFGGVAYRFESDTELGLRATSIDYKTNGQEADANAIGLYVRLYR